MSDTKKPTIYVPKSNAKVRETSIGLVFNISFLVEEFIKFAEEHKNEKGYINLSCLPRKEETDYSTHSVTLDQWKPNSQTEGASTSRPAARAKTAAAPKADQPGDDIPF